MKFLLDENVRFEVSNFLTSEGYDVKRTPSGIKNGQVIKLAVDERRILVTSDVHFSNILVYPPHKYCGIIRLKIHPPSAAKEIAALKRLFREVSSHSTFDKKLFILEENDFRVRK